ncbi:MAG: hypothetical protein PHE73_07290 [Sulfurovaceae bacterium]|nr:hypothetical protein [Sulfurovaceae bacterium]
MALFSSSLIRDYSMDEALIATRWANFQKFLSKIDKEINQMVYKLYGLTDDEINIAEMI